LFGYFAVYLTGYLIGCVSEYFGGCFVGYFDEYFAVDFVVNSDVNLVDTLLDVVFAGYADELNAETVESVVANWTVFVDNSMVVETVVNAVLELDYPPFLRLPAQRSIDGLSKIIRYFSQFCLLLEEKNFLEKKRRSRSIFR
jgi:hypothetical protein